MDNYRNMLESRISAEAKEKLPCSGKPDADVSSWSYDMEGHAKKYVESYCELANKTNHQLYKVVTPCLAWSYDTDGHAKKCVERCCELTNKKTNQLYKVSTLCFDDHHFKNEELESVRELSKVSSQNVDWTWARKKMTNEYVSLPPF